MLTKNILIAIAITSLAISAPVLAEDAKIAPSPTLTSTSMTWRSCTEGYFEGVHLDRVATNTGFFYGKVGYCADHVLMGLVSRIGADTRTANDPSSAVFNDNYLFIGAGATWYDAIPGVRVLGEAGYSFDLSHKINLSGPDFRVGWASYHEIPLPVIAAVSEYYSEGFYIRRYFNFLLNLQPRLFWGFIKPDPSIAIGPVLGLNFSFDTANDDYNRFIEFNYGIKGKWFPLSNTSLSGYSLGAQLYGVRGFRTDSNTDLAAYSDFRILLFGYYSFQ